MNIIKYFIAAIFSLLDKVPVKDTFPNEEKLQLLSEKFPKGRQMPSILFNKRALSAS